MAKRRNSYERRTCARCGYHGIDVFPFAPANGLVLCVVCMGYYADGGDGSGTSHTTATVSPAD